LPDSAPSEFFDDGDAKSNFPLMMLHQVTLKLATIHL
jgi:hypothetical protein